MSRAPYVMGKADSAFSRGQKIEDTTIGWRFVNPLMKKQYGIDSMPETAENVAEQYKVSREDQDLFAFRSQEKAARAKKEGRFAEEIVPVFVPRRKQDPLVFDTDEHPRADTTLESLAALRPIRRLLPSLGGIDFSPIILMLLVQFVIITLGWIYTRIGI